MTITAQEPVITQALGRSESQARQQMPITAPTPPPMLDIVVPVYNEQATLDASIQRLHRYLSTELPVTWRITIADNASTDATWPLACGLARGLRNVRAIRLAQKGRGRALHAAWRDSDATVLAYMDVDLSTDLAALQPLIAPLLSGHSDLAIGTRLTHSSRVVRGPKREVISRIYNGILHTALRTKFSDAQCGFKAIRKDRADQLLPLVEDNEWFFDTELLVLAERAGLRIHEVPVDWVDDPDSRVDIKATAIADLKGVARLARGFAAGTISVAAIDPVTPSTSMPATTRRQAVPFVAIGIASTVAYLALYVALRGSLGAGTANAVALAVTAIGNTAANRRLTFGLRSRTGMVRHQLQGLVVFGLALTLTTGSLAALHRGDPGASRGLEISVLLIANLAATVVRFVLLRSWVFRKASSAR